MTVPDDPPLDVDSRQLCHNYYARLAELAPRVRANLPPEDQKRCTEASVETPPGTTVTLLGILTYESAKTRQELKRLSAVSWEPCDRIDTANVRDVPREAFYLENAGGRMMFNPYHLIGDLDGCGHGNSLLPGAVVAVRCCAYEDVAEDMLRPIAWWTCHSLDVAPGQTESSSSTDREKEEEEEKEPTVLVLTSEPSPSGQVCNLATKGRVVVAGGIMPRKTNGCLPKDSLFASLMSMGRVDVFPSGADLHPARLPQYPLPPGLVRRRLHLDPQSDVHFASNPYHIEVDGEDVVGISGDLLTEALRYRSDNPPHPTVEEDIARRLDVLQGLVSMSHLAPTAPCTYPCDAMALRDVLTLARPPAVLFVGGQDRGASRYWHERSTGKTGMLVLVPRVASDPRVAAISVHPLSCVWHEVTVPATVPDTMHQ